jgi:glutamine synthetase
MDLADVERFLSPMQTVECCFPDTWGTLVGRRMPAETFLRAASEGLSMPNAAFAWNLVGEIEPTPFASAETGFPNMHVAPDLATLREAPWADRTAFCLMDPFEDRGGAPHPMSTRAMLRRSVAELGDLGYDAWVAPELEFYLCTEDWQPVSAEHRCWSMTRGAEDEPVVGEIRSVLLAAGVPIESSQTEGGPGQLEINVGPSSPLEAADNAALLKYVVKMIARRHGLRATFMPMPFQGEEGSGHHLHESLRRKGSEDNVFASDDAVFDAYLAGVLEHMADLTATALPTVNAYKRLRDYTYAPNRVSWGIDNRTVAVRIPAGDPRSRRLEIRTASADANPYLIIAASIDSGADGLARSLEPPKPTEGDAYLDGSLERLPATLGEAIERFAGNAFCRDRFGDAFVDTYSVVCRREEAAFREHVTDWERSRYLDHA